MFGFTLPPILNPYVWLIKIVLAAVAVVAALYMWHLFTDHYREQGRVEVRTKYNALITKCDLSLMKPDACANDWTNLRSNNLSLTSDLSACQSVARLQGEQAKKNSDFGVQIRAEADRIIAQGKKNAEANSATPYVKSLEAKMSAPRAATKEKECENVIGTVDDAAARWLRYYGPDAGKGARPQDGAGAGAGGGALRISR